MRKKRSHYHLWKMRNSRCRWTNRDLPKTQIAQYLHPPLVSIPSPSGQERLQKEGPPPVLPSK